MAGATAELRQTRDTISTQRMELGTVVQLKSSIKNLEYIVAFYKKSGKSIKSELAAKETESIRLGQLFDDVRPEVSDIQQKLGGRDAVTQSIVGESCPLLGPFSGALSRISMRVLISRWAKPLVLTPLRLSPC